MSKNANESHSITFKDRLQASQFKLMEKLGTGSFGSVYRAIHKPTQTVCAVKRIDMENSDDEIDEIQKEIAILAECNDSHITKYYGCFVHDYELWIAMEYLGGGSCLDLIKQTGPLPESAIAEIMGELLSGLAYLHMNGKIHRDIKAANVLVAEDGSVKIADFGVAAQLSNNLSKRNTFVGTPFWMAPEVIDQKSYSFPADIWSLGITAMELANGSPPLSHIPPMKALFTIPRNDPPRLDERFSTEFKDFVAQCLQKDHTQRMPLGQLRSHPFLRRASRKELVYIIHQRQSPASVKVVSARRESSSITTASTLTGDTSDWDADIDPNPIISTTRTFSENSDNDDDDDEVDDWTFDSTVRPTAHASLEQLLQNPPEGLKSLNPGNQVAVESPVPTPSPPPSTGTVSSLASTIDANAMDTLTLKNSKGIQRHSNLVRVFDHAYRKFKDPVLREITDIMVFDPPTVAVEQYIVQKICKLAMDRQEIRPVSDQHAAPDVVEEVLFQRWLGELQN